MRSTLGPREFLDCVAHIRLLSWLLLGSVNHTLRYGGNVGGIAVSEVIISQPIPLDASCHIADHIQVILAGFAGEEICTYMVLYNPVSTFLGKPSLICQFFFLF